MAELALNNNHSLTHSNNIPYWVTSEVIFSTDQSLTKLPNFEIHVVKTKHNAES